MAGYLSLILHSLVYLIHLDAVFSQMQQPPSGEQLPNLLARNESRILTTLAGAPIQDRANVLTAGVRGPVVLHDVPFIEEMQHFNRERIPRRVVHAKGTGAFGYFVVTDDITRYTKAVVFSKRGKRTEIAVRFSFALIEQGAPDVGRDIRGFAIKFYTEDGIWDLAGNHAPMFIVRDPYMFSSFVHAFNRNPTTNLYDVNATWDFISLRPESLNQIVFAFSDRGTPYSFRHIHGFSINTFRLVNNQGKSVFCRFVYTTDQGIRNLTNNESIELGTTDADHSTRDLYNAIAQGRYPSWTLSIQVMTTEQAENSPWNPFDVTKMWLVRDFPLIRVGKIVLNRNPSNNFADVEQIAFCPGNLIPGIEIPAADKSLHGRVFAYADAHLYRLGSNRFQLPINSPYRSQVFNTMRDGEAVYTDNFDGYPNYYPNSYVRMLTSRRARIIPDPVQGYVNRYDTSDEDNFSQPRYRWREELDATQRANLIENMALQIVTTTPFIQRRLLNLFYRIDNEFGAQLNEALQARS